MNILILGAGGMAGHIISDYLKEKTSWNIISFSRTDFEVEGDWKEKIYSLSDLKYIINCIGILKVANKNPVLGIKVNSLFPHELAQFATKKGIKVIHLSTDCWNDLDLYGRSKRAGELDYPNHLTIRTSIIGPELKNGTGLFHWFMIQEGEVSGFTRHFWDGITTLELAKAIKHIIENKASLCGIIDLRTENKVTKYSLLNYFKEIFNKEIKIKKLDTEKVDKTNSFPNVTLKKELIEQIIELKKWMLDHQDQYSQYIK